MLTTTNPKAAGTLPLTRAQDAFLIDRQVMRVTPRTLQFYNYTLGAFLVYLHQHGVTAPETITPQHIRGFLTELQERGLADTTQHMHARAIKTWCKWMHAEGYTPENPMSRVSMPKLDKKILPALSTDDVRKLLLACEKKRDKAIVFCLLDTGARAQEFCSLALSDLDMKTGLVTIREGKGRKFRFTRLGAKSRKALLVYLKDRPEAAKADPLFLSQTGVPLTPNSLLLILTRLGQRAGVEHCSPHTFRRTFCLWAHRAGMNDTDLQMMMGHSDLSIIHRYLDMDKHDAEVAHQAYGPVDNML